MHHVSLGYAFIKPNVRNNFSNTLMYSDNLLLG